MCRVLYIVPDQQRCKGDLTWEVSTAVNVHIMSDILTNSVRKVLSLHYVLPGCDAFFLWCVFAVFEEHPARLHGALTKNITVYKRLFFYLVVNICTLRMNVRG